MTLLPILDQNHKGSVLKIAKVPLQISFKHSKPFLAFLKGQLISKGVLMFSISSKKRTKEFDFTTMIPQIDLFSFVFWRKAKTPKNHFEIIWPLINAPLVIFPSSFTISITWTAFYVTTHDYNCKQYSKCHTDNNDDSSRLWKKIHFRIIRGEAWAATKYLCSILNFVFKDGKTKYF